MAIGLSLGLGATTAIGLAAGERADSRVAPTGATVTTTEHGTVIARKADRRRGLIFEVHSSTGILAGSDLYVRLSRDAPRATRRAVTSSPLVATCSVPGRKVGEFAGRWDARFRQYGTALLTEPPVVVAKVATTCALWIGTEGTDAGTATFGDAPFSRVRLR
jgi:hypothetical protein